MTKTKSSLQRAIERIKDAGFSHIKVELEAELDREEYDTTCDECYGEGYEDCAECDGTGVVTATLPNGNTTEVECDECYGAGSIECERCDGDGRITGEGNYEDEDECETFMRNYVSESARQHLTYGNFYNDGSVDSEFTFTLPVEHAKDVVEWINAFKELAKEIGHDMDTAGAGMHISVLPKESNGYYPVSEGTLNATKARNFEREMTKLMPALFFLATSNDVSRGLEYRKPYVGKEKYPSSYASSGYTREFGNYPAILSNKNSSYEFRVFETCYDDPEYIFTFFEVIGNALQFYKDPSKKVEAIGKDFTFNSKDNSVARFYQSPEAIKILRAQLKYLKPADKTIRELFQERSTKFIGELKQEHSVKIKEARKLYKQQQEHFKTQLETPLTDYQKDALEYLKKAIVVGYEPDMTEEEQIMRVKGLRQLPTLVEFIQQQVFSSAYRGYTIKV